MSKESCDKKQMWLLANFEKGNVWSYLPSYHRTTDHIDQSFLRKFSNGQKKRTVSECSENRE